MRWASDQLADEVLLQSYDDATATVCHENTVPAFVEDAIERRYGSLFSALPHLRQSGKLKTSTCSYVTHRNGQIETLLLFDRSQRRLTVLNELIALSSAELAAFVAFVFERYPSVSAICLNAVSTKLDRFGYPAQRYFCSEDIVIAALSSPAEYTQRLKKSTRKSLRRHESALLRAWPSARFCVLSTAAISEALVRQIIGFNKARMASKERVSAYTEAETQWIVAMAGARGLAVTVMIDGQLCAGAVCCNIAGRFFVLVTAHDPDYDQFGLGMLCSYRTICECIARDGKEVHLLWGRLAYKTDLGGAPRRFDRVTIYRSRTACLRHADQAVRAGVSGVASEIRLWLMNAEGQPSVRGRLADIVWRCARTGKRAVKAIRTMAA